MHIVMAALPVFICILGLGTVITVMANADHSKALTPDQTKAWGWVYVVMIVVSVGGFIYSVPELVTTDVTHSKHEGDIHVRT